MITDPLESALRCLVPPEDRANEESSINETIDLLMRQLDNMSGAKQSLSVTSAMTEIINKYV